MPSVDRKRSFRVLIAGGGIAGLTLANALQHADIDFLLLEARAEIAPQLGASIGLSPNGGRILDQLGCYDDIMQLTEPLRYTGNHYANGDLINPRTDGFRLVQTRTNYSMAFLDRQSLLRVLAAHVRESSRRIKLNKRIATAEHRTGGALVTCTDGSSHFGDVLVGADGIYSTTRREMWRAARSDSPGEIPDEEMQNTMTAEYKCLFGISAAHPSLPPQSFDVTFRKDVAPLVVTSNARQVHWFLIARMPRVFHAGHIPSFSQDDARAFAEENRDIPLTPGGTVSFGDIWATKHTCNLVALEEAFFEHWTYGRFVCLGDSVHKMTPNMGAGGNCAIESAASLANSLHELIMSSSPAEHRPSPPVEAIRQALRKYQETRRVRALATVRASNLVTRLDALSGRLAHIIAHCFLPISGGDMLIDWACDAWIGAQRLDYLPVPLRSLRGTMPFNPEQGMGKYESISKRAVAASSFLVPLASHRVLLRYYYYYYPTVPGGVDAATSSWQLCVFLADFGTIYSVLLVESARHTNRLSPIQLVLLFGMAARFVGGAGTALPLYFFLYSTCVPIARFKAADMRLTDLRYTRSILPVMLLAYYAPYLVAFTGPTAAARQAALWVLQLFPLWVSVGQWLVKHILLSSSTTYQDRHDNVTRDIGTIRHTIGTVALWSAMSWLAMLWKTPSSSAWALGGATRITEEVSLDSLLVLGAHGIPRYDYLVSTASSFLWIFYVYRDLKRAGMVEYGWLRLISFAGALGVCVGPGATVALAWLYRENILATKRHKGALI